MRYVFDRQRHLICVPYSIENLHKMADDLGIKRCWYHGGKYPHYDVPKRMMPTMHEHAEPVESSHLLGLIQKALEDEAPNE